MNIPAESRIRMPNWNKFNCLQFQASICQQSVLHLKTVTERCQLELDAKKPFSCVEPVRELLLGRTNRVPMELAEKQYIFQKRVSADHRQ